LSDPDANILIYPLVTILSLFPIRCGVGNEKRKR